MSVKRKIEIFGAGCAVCQEAIEQVNRLACPSCEVTVLDTRDPSLANRARALGIRAVPAVVVNGNLAACCVGRGPTESELRAAGVGQPI